MAAIAASADPARRNRIARGSYLANGVARCFWCHSPLDASDPAVPRPEKLGSGDILDAKKPIVAPNITPDGKTGIGSWTDAQLIRAIREGTGRDGQRLPTMPSTYYSVMTDEDAGSIVAYLRSLRPIGRRLPRSAAAEGSGSEHVQRATAPARPEALRRPLDRGTYLVQLGECIGCHTTTDGRGQPDRTMAFAGGRRFVVAKGFGDELFPDPLSAPGAAEPSGTIVTSANITPHASGIAFYDEDIFIKTIRTGRVAGVRALSSAMPWVFFRNMTDDDLRAVFAYLKTVRPVAHRVSNVDPPTLCPRCGRRHGLGDLNPPNPK